MVNSRVISPTEELEEAHIDTETLRNRINSLERKINPEIRQ